jgi:hypothetical protein
MKRNLSILFSFFILISFKAISLPSLNSFPSAKATIFLDFDGQFVEGTSWNGGTPFYAASSGFSDDQITEVFNRVSEDYRPFNINITTDSSVFFSAPYDKRIRVIVTNTSAWYSNVGGVSYTGSFTWGDDTPAFVFVDRLAYSTKNVAECCSHESGHTLGLSHQAKYNGSCTLIATYNDGVGTGEIGWAPVMGNSYGKNLSGWNNGPTPNGCTADQDNLSIITSRNGFGYRVDDYADDPKTAVETKDFLHNGSLDGIISTNIDKDVFRIFIPANGKLKLSANPFSVGAANDGANLDIKISIVNSSFDVVKVYDPENTLNVEIDTLLNSGIYFLLLEGAGNINTSNYGSLGSYTMKASFAATPSAASIVLSGNVENDKHELKWQINCEEPVKNIVLENSLNQTIFNTQSTFSTQMQQYAFVPSQEGNISYRIKITTQTGKVFYSNIVTLNAATKIRKFIVPNFVHSEIKINALENFKFQLSDMNGRTIKNGSVNSGINSINLNNCPNGIYFLQIISNSQRTTERIVKL